MALAPVAAPETALLHGEQGAAALHHQRSLGRKRSSEDPADGMRHRKHSKSSNGDAEQTESDSEADSLFPEEVAAETARAEYPGLDQGPATLSLEQLLQRRLDYTQRLYQLYMTEYWSLLEEFRARHNHILRKARQNTQDLPDGIPPAGPVHLPESILSFKSMQVLLHEAPAPAAPGVSDPFALQTATPAAAAPSAAMVDDITPHGSAEVEQHGAAAEADANGHMADHAGEPGSGEAAQGVAGSIVSVDVDAALSEEAQQRSEMPQDAATQLPGSDGGQPAVCLPPPESVEDPGAAGVPAAELGGPTTPTVPHTEVPDFEHVKAVVFSTDPRLPVASQQQLSAWRSAFQSHLSEVSRLEQVASAAGAREMDADGALAVLLSHAVQYTIRCSAASVGRNTGSCGQVDVDLTLAGCAKRVSRQQATLALGPDGKFALRNIGRRAFFVNSRMVNQGQAAPLVHLSHLDIGGLQLLFLINHLAVQRALNRTQQQDVLART